MNPCPCMSLGKGVKILAIVDAVLSVLNVGTLILALVGLLAWHEELELEKQTKTIAIAAIVIGMILCILEALLAVKLYRGAKDNDHRSCRFWLLVTIVLTVITVISLIVNSTSGDFHGASFGVSVVALGYKAYEIFVVYTFMGVLANQGGVGSPSV
ncbi:unnamed protein product [Orchesella dallaii]|uniref:Uncharacterized protein n=1 Tax=Orchesella dallaii TaxID=48710 RepID=A0ABP1PZJ5_9HEXA